MSALTRRPIWRVLQLVLMLAALVYAGVAVSNRWAEFQLAASRLQPNWGLIALSSILILATYAILVESWRMLVAGFGSTVRFIAAARIITISKLGLYMPGKIWSVIGLGMMAEKEGVPPAAAAGSALLGTALNLGAGFGVVALSGSRILNGMNSGLRLASLFGAAAFVSAVIAAPWLLPRLTRWASTRFKRAVPVASLPASTLWLAVTLNVISWFGYGWAFMMFSRAIVPGIAGTLPQFVAVWAASYLAGYLMLFAPGGIGFREIAITGLLVKLGLAGTAEAALISGASRLWLIALELVPGLIALALTPLSKRIKTKVAG